MIKAFCLHDSHRLELSRLGLHGHCGQNRAKIKPPLIEGTTIRHVQIVKHSVYRTDLDCIVHVADVDSLRTSLRELAIQFTQSGKDQASSKKTVIGTGSTALLEVSKRRGTDVVKPVTFGLEDVRKELAVVAIAPSPVTFVAVPKESRAM